MTFHNSATMMIEEKEKDTVEYPSTSLHTDGGKIDPENGSPEPKKLVKEIGEISSSVNCTKERLLMLQKEMELIEATSKNLNAKLHEITQPQQLQLDEEDLRQPEVPTRNEEEADPGNGNQDIDSTMEQILRIVKETPVNERLLERPPFRFIHDVFMEIVKVTGFGEGLFVDKELDAHAQSESKQTKVAWLEKLIEAVSVSSNRSMIHISAVKIAAGKQVGNTLFLLRMLMKEALKEKENPTWKQTLGRIQSGEEIIIKPAPGDASARRHSYFLNKTWRPSNVTVDRVSRARKLRVGLNEAMFTPSNLYLFSSTGGNVVRHPHEGLVEHYVERKIMQDDLGCQFRKRNSESSNTFAGDLSIRTKGDTHCFAQLYLFGPKTSSSVKLERIPQQILMRSIFPNLRVISFVDLGLEDFSFPEETAVELPACLTTLALSKNCLRHIPAVFRSIDSLLELRVNHNRVEDIDFTGFPKLKRFIGSRNRLTNLSESILDQCPDLEEFWVDHNELKRIPYELEGLKVLQCDNNPFSDEETELKQVDFTVAQQPPETTADQVPETELENKDTVLDLRGFHSSSLDDQHFLGKHVEQVVIFRSQIDMILDWQGPRRSVRSSQCLELLFSLPNINTIFVVCGQATNDALRTKPVECLLELSTHEKLELRPPRYMDKVHRELSIGFHIVNSTVMMNGLVCKILVTPRNFDRT